MLLVIGVPDDLEELLVAFDAAAVLGRAGSCAGDAPRVANPDSGVMIFSTTMSCSQPSPKSYSYWNRALGLGATWLSRAFRSSFTSHSYSGFGFP